MTSRYIQWKSNVQTEHQYIRSWITYEAHYIYIGDIWCSHYLNKEHYKQLGNKNTVNSNSSYKNITLLYNSNCLCLYKSKAERKNCGAPKGTVCLHKMIQPTLGRLTKICLYLPRQFSHEAIFLLCQRPSLSRCIII